jgi:hypothetical protein
MSENTKKHIWACVIPLVLAGVCFFMRNFMQELGQKECNESLGFHLDFDSFSYASDSTGFLNQSFGFLVFVFIRLSMMLPFTLYLRRVIFSKQKISIRYPLFHLKKAHFRNKILLHRPVAKTLAGRRSA